VVCGRGTMLTTDFLSKDRGIGSLQVSQQEAEDQACLLDNMSGNLNMARKSMDKFKEESQQRKASLEKSVQVMQNDKVALVEKDTFASRSHFATLASASIDFGNALQAYSGFAKSENEEGWSNCNGTTELHAKQLIPSTAQTFMLPSLHKFSAPQKKAIYGAIGPVMEDLCNVMSLDGEGVPFRMSCKLRDLLTQQVVRSCRRHTSAWLHKVHPALGNKSCTFAMR
jgi:hypothetical protein